MRLARPIPCRGLVRRRGRCLLRRRSFILFHVVVFSGGLILGADRRGRRVAPRAVKPARVVHLWPLARGTALIALGQAVQPSVVVRQYAAVRAAEDGALAARRREGAEDALVEERRVLCVLRLIVVEAGLLDDLVGKKLQDVVQGSNEDTSTSVLPDDASRAAAITEVRSTLDALSAHVAESKAGAAALNKINETDDAPDSTIETMRDIAAEYISSNSMIQK